MISYKWDIAGKKVLVLGSQGLIGSALTQRLQKEPCHLIAATRQDADLLCPEATLNLFEKTKPDAVFLAAAKVGGILANRDNPVPFLQDNLAIQLNTIKAAHAADVERFVLLGSSCIYPKLAEQPIQESSLLTGALEPTNDAYAIAKIAGIRLIDAYRQQYGRHWISAMPTNLYGPNDNFDPISSHVLPALIRKFHDAKKNDDPNVTLWGSGKVFREFMHAEDCADALVFLLQNYDDMGPINIGTGDDLTIASLADIIKTQIGYEGDIQNDLTKPDGTPRKLMDNTRLKRAGWSPKINLETGIEATYAWYLKQLETRA